MSNKMFLVPRTEVSTTSLVTGEKIKKFLDEQKFPDVSVKSSSQEQDQLEVTVSNLRLDTANGNYVELVLTFVISGRRHEAGCYIATINLKICGRSGSGIDAYSPTYSKIR